MQRVAESFSWPFRGQWRSRWLVGIVLVLFLPLGFLPLLGYSIDAIRAARSEQGQGPPPWRWSARLFGDGAVTALAIAVITAPFAIAYVWIGRLLNPTAVVQVILLFGLALPWGCALLLVMPHCSARLAETGRWTDIFDFTGAVRTVARNFAAWNATVAAIVTAWALGLAGAGLLCVGALPGVFYAILVSAYAAAAFHRSSSTSSSR
ncbi:MAG TPA: DUF4013 domain-containing protein [Candidatus Udaeobacter sp.]|nr:DUF4013 domain-containing protein [Candidatus Udaeobacter sp.]